MFDIFRANAGRKRRAPETRWSQTKRDDRQSRGKVFFRKSGSLRSIAATIGLARKEVLDPLTSGGISSSCRYNFPVEGAYAIDHAACGEALCSDCDPTRRRIFGFRGGTKTTAVYASREGVLCRCRRGCICSPWIND